LKEKDTVIVKLKERLKSLSGNVQDEKIKRELEEIETINIELDHSVTKLVAENEHLKQTYKQLYDSIKSPRVRSKEQCNDLIKQVNIKSTENSDLNASLQEKVLVIAALKETLSRLKGKAVVNEAVSSHSIDLELLKINVAPLAPKLRNNKTAHIDYLRHTQEKTATLREIVERTKLMAVTPKNNDKKIRLTKHIPLSGNTPAKTTSSTNVVSNTPVLSSTGVNLLSSTSGSQPQGNTKNDRIQRAPSKPKKNKLEDHHRTVRPSLNKRKNVVDTKAILSVTNSKLNVNADLKCATCNGCLFSDNHDACVLAYINSVNSSLKSKYVKKPVNRKFWQPIGKMFTTVGHIWKPTGQTFTLVRNVCPLTRIATTAIVPLREHIPIESNTDKPVVTLVYSRKPKASKTKSWLWHRRLSHLNFGAINHLARQGLVRGLPKLKFEKDHLCSACAMGKSTKKSYKPKSEDTNQEKLYLLHMDLCGPMRVESVNGKKYILVPVCRIRTDNGIEFGNQTLREYYEEVGISHETSVARCPQKNDVVERRNRTLIEAARTILIYAQAPLFLWAEAVATVCFTQNRSIIRLRHGKTPYELLHNKLPDLSYLHVFGALCYPTNDSENLEKLQPKADIGIFIGYAPTKKAFQIYNRRTRRIFETIHVDFDELTVMASEQSSSGPALNEMTPATISSGLMQKSSSSTPYVLPSRNDWDLLFQPMFDELLNPPPSVNHQAPEVIASIVDVIPPVQADSTDSHSSTTVDQDAPSPSKSHTTTETQSLVIPQDVKEDNLDIKVAHMGNDPLFGVPIPEVTSAQSSSTASPHSIVQPNHPIPQHNNKWTKDHPLQNIIGQLSRPVSTRLQLHEQALFCYYDAFLTSVEPKTYKKALTQSCWIEAMQEELNEFERLKVWELVPRPDKVMVITLKWIYKVKLNELGGILKNKALIKTW
nr:hypothetical protein [Tanacetum cinerariifolium]